MAKRTKFEAGGDEYDYVAKCMKCKHSYTRRDKSDVLFCRLKNVDTRSIKKMSTTNDDEMLKKWLSNKEEKAFENGIKFACEKILNKCNAAAMPVCLSIRDSTFYVSIDEIKEIIKQINNNKD